MLLIKFHFCLRRPLMIHLHIVYGVSDNWLLRAWIVSRVAVSSAIWRIIADLGPVFWRRNGYLV